MKLKEVMLYKDWKLYLEELPAFINLHPLDKDFFRGLFDILFFNDKINNSNEQLARKFGLAESTVKNKLHRLEQANLITRKAEVASNHNYKWCDYREIKFNELTFPGIYKVAGFNVDKK